MIRSPVPSAVARSLPSGDTANKVKFIAGEVAPLPLEQENISGAGLVHHEEVLDGHLSISATGGEPVSLWVEG